MIKIPDQDVRRYPQHEDDHRNSAARDADRIAHSTNFRRLAGVAQVTWAGETQLFHNRLTHTIKVSRVALGLLNLIKKEQRFQKTTTKKVAQQLEPDRLVAVCYAHDLGHPPFGHIAEKELDNIVRETCYGGDQDGFEGNAQSFRIVTKLAIHNPEPEAYPGLNLTRGH